MAEALYSSIGTAIRLRARPRQTVPLEAPSAYLSEAFLTIEDKSFREHGGIDWLRVPGALLANLCSKEVEQDFSTITMQLARNVFPERISASQWRRELWRQPPRTEAAREEVFLASHLPPEGCPAGGGARERHRTRDSGGADGAAARPSTNLVLGGIVRESAPRDPSPIYSSAFRSVTRCGSSLNARSSSPCSCAGR